MWKLGVSALRASDVVNRPKGVVRAALALARLADLHDRLHGKTPRGPASSPHHKKPRRDDTRRIHQDVTLFARICHVKLDAWPGRRASAFSNARFSSPLLVRRERVRVRVFFPIRSQSPHPNPLPAYREREKRENAVALGWDGGGRRQHVIMSGHLSPAALESRGAVKTRPHARIDEPHPTLGEFWQDPCRCPVPCWAAPRRPRRRPMRFV